jgi:hypothetical protein
VVRSSASAEAKPARLFKCSLEQAAEMASLELWEPRSVGCRGQRPHKVVSTEIAPSSLIKLLNLMSRMVKPHPENNKTGRLSNVWFRRDSDKYSVVERTY